MLEIEREKTPKYWWSWMPVASALSLCLIAGVWIISSTGKREEVPLLSFQNTVREVGQESLGKIAIPAGQQTGARSQSGGGGG